MKKIISSIMLLGLLSSCNNNIFDSEPKYIIGDCIKGSTHTFIVTEVSTYSDRYLLQAIKPKNSAIYRLHSWMRFKVAHKSLKQVKCDF